MAELILLSVSVSLVACDPATGDEPWRGTPLTLSQLKEGRIDMTFSANCTESATGECSGAVGLILADLDYRPFPCPIVKADVRIQGVVIPQTDTGGMYYCPTFSLEEGACRNWCNPPMWHGDVSSVLAELAMGGEVEMTDGTSTWHLTIDRPLVAVSIALRGLVPGDSVSAKPLLVDLTPHSTMSPAEFQADASGQTLRHLSIELLQGRRVFAPVAGALTYAPTEGPWTFSFSPSFREGLEGGPAPDSATLVFSLLTSDLSFSGCPDGMTCVGGSLTRMLRFPIVYAP